jgi:hypothetical protein
MWRKQPHRTSYIADDLVSCVLTVANGGKWFPADLVETALERETGRRVFREETDQILTTREREIAFAGRRRSLEQAGGGAARHRRGYLKCGMQNRTSLAAFARTHVTADTQQG